MDAQSLRTVPVNKEYISVFNKYKVENEMNMYNKLLDLKGNINVNRLGMKDLIDGVFKNERKSKHQRFTQRRFSEFYNGPSLNASPLESPTTLKRKKRKEEVKNELRGANKREALIKLQSQVLVNESQSGFYSK